MSEEIRREIDNFVLRVSGQDPELYAQLAQHLETIKGSICYGSGADVGRIVNNALDPIREALDLVACERPIGWKELAGPMEELIDLCEEFVENTEQETP